MFFLRDIRNLAMVIPAMGLIDSVLSTSVANQCFTPAIWAALTMGKQTLTHYYTKTNMSDVYRIAMGA